MPLIEYKCPAGHVTEIIVPTKRVDNLKAKVPCETCVCVATRVEYPRTGAPILKPGVGGFYKPTQ